MDELLKVAKGREIWMKGRGRDESYVGTKTVWFGSPVARLEAYPDDLARSHLPWPQRFVDDVPKKRPSAISKSAWGISHIGRLDTTMRPLSSHRSCQISQLSSIYAGTEKRE